MPTLRIENTMNVPLSREKSASRSEQYIKELRDLFLSHGMKVGSSENLLPLASQLSAPGPIYDDITSEVRSIIYREHEAIPKPELLGIIVTAMAGAPFTDPPGDIQPAIDQLKTYVAEVITAVRRKTPALDLDDPDDAGSSLSPIDPSFGPPADLEPWPQAADPRITMYEFEEPGPSAAPLIASSLPPAEVLPRYDTPTPLHDLSALHPSSVDLQVQPVAMLQPIAARNAPPPRRSTWAFTIAAAFLLLLASLFLRYRSQPASAQHASTVASPASSAQIQAPPPSSPASEPSKPVAHTGPTPPKPSAAHPAHLAASIGSPSIPTPPSASRVPQPTPQPTPSRPRRPRPPISSPTTSATSRAGKQSFLVSSGVMDGNLITVPTTPNYPMMANMTGIEGKVILQAVVSRNGTVVATHVLDGHRLLRKAAAHAVRSWRYRPYLVNGKPADVATIVIVDFHLKQ